MSGLFGEITIDNTNKMDFGNTHDMEGLWEPTGLNPVFRLCRVFLSFFLTSSPLVILLTPF